MAFETVETWQVERRWRESIPPLLWSPEVSAEIPFAKQLEKAPSAAFALALNGLFLYALVTSAFDRPFDDLAAQNTLLEETLTMLDLGSPTEEKEEPKPAEGGSGNPARTNPRISDLDLTTKTELPPEWSVGRVRVARAEPAASDVSAGVGNAAGAGTGTGADDGVYDPYAGAAPNRKDEQEQDRRLPDFDVGFGGDGIDRAAFDKWVEELRNRLPRARGSVELAVSIGSDGRVKSAKVTGGSASAQVKFFVRNAAIGQRMASDRGTEVRLPLVRFG